MQTQQQITNKPDDPTSSGQNREHFANIFFSNTCSVEICIPLMLIRILIRLVPKGPIDNDS